MGCFLSGRGPLRMIPFHACRRLDAKLRGAVRLNGERVERVAAGHIEAVVLRTAEAQVGAALRQPDEADRLALRIEHRHAVEVLGPSFQLIHLAAADLSRLLVERAGAPPAAPEIAVL